jgi:mono/diheme cytochrome c family protein
MKVAQSVRALVLAAALITPLGAHAADPAAGKLKFNSNCGSCHGEDAVQADPAADLRQLQKRHADKTPEVFAKTVKDGIPEKGMPSWDGVLTTEDLADIEEFLKSVQTS